MNKFYRHGDINIHPIKNMPNGLKKIKHDGSFILARGEATGSVHLLTAKRTEDLVLMQDEHGNTYLELKSPAKLTHTKDHEPLIIQPGIYKQVQEREVDHFSQSITRKVID